MIWICGASVLGGLVAILVALPAWLSTGVVLAGCLALVVRR